MPIPTTRASPRSVRLFDRFTRDYHSLFTGEEEEDCRRARLALRYILNSDTVIPIPGMCTVDEVENIVKAVEERRQLDVREVSELHRANEAVAARLPAGYQWLKDWEYV